MSKTLNPLRLDPSGTGMIRRKLLAELRGRYGVLSSQIWKRIVDDDCFGVKSQQHNGGATLLWNAPKYHFEYDPAQKQAFLAWLNQRIAEGEIYDIYKEQKNLGGTVQWSRERAANYVGSSYRAGVVNAWNVGAKQNPSPEYDVTAQTDFTNGTREQFLNDAFNGPVAKKTLELLSTRAYDQFEGVDAEMARKMSRILSDGFLRGENPREIARALRKEVGFTKERALRIARTEIIHAQAEGQLDALEMLGHDHVGVLVEYSTAHNDGVCPQCAALDGLVMTIADARGLYPIHPNCRCTPVPYIGKKPSVRELAKAKKITDSVKAGRGPKKAPPEKETPGEKEDRKRQEAIQRMERISPAMAQELRKKWDMDYDPAAAAKIEDDIARRLAEAEAAVREIERGQMEIYKREQEEKERRYREEIESLKLEIERITKEDDENSRKIEQMTPERRKAEEKITSELFGGIQVDYSGMDRPLVEHNNEGFREVVEKYPFLRDSVRTVSSYTPPSDRTLAEFTPGVKEFLISSRNTLDRMLATIAAEYKTGYYSSDSVHHLIRHEMGHALHDYVFSEIRRTQGLRAARNFDKELERLFDELTSQSKAKNDILSRRGKERFHEMVAESFAEMMEENPRDFAKKVIALLLSKILPPT